MKKVKIILRFSVISFLIYCLFSTYPNFIHPDWINEDLSINIPHIIGSYLSFFIIFAFMAAIVGTAMLALNWIFSNKKEINNQTP